MIYTQQRRRSMNKAVRELYPDIDFYESPDGIPVMVCSTLPEGAVQIMDSEDFINRIKNYCRRENEMGTTIIDYRKAYPVFIRSLELGGKSLAEARIYFRVNYVSATENSIRKAEEYINEGKLYAVQRNL